MNRVAEQHVSTRFEADAKPRSDMLGSMIKHGLNQVECETEGLFMIIAGTESTASAIRSALMHTITTSHAYQALKQEIREAVKEGRVSSPITTAEAKKLPYLQVCRPIPTSFISYSQLLQAVIYESLRMRPPLIGFFPKVVPPQGDTMLGYDIPGGTAVGFNASAILSSTELFGDDADIFRPERFLELEDAGRKQMERDVELTFGHGQWGCVGKTIAFMEMNKSVFEVSPMFSKFLGLDVCPDMCDRFSDISIYSLYSHLRRARF